MPGYLDRLIRTEYPDLGEKVYVEYRNPRTAAASVLYSDSNNNLTARELSYQTISRLLRTWCVYDATVDEDDAPELEGPATPEMVSKMPLVIINDIMTNVNGALAGPR